MIKHKKVVLILSGGMDSATLLYTLLSEGVSVNAISFNYGQRHKRELLSARKLAQKRAVPHFLADLPINIIPNSSALFGGTTVAMPNGPYDVENMKQTVVPNRNMCMIAFAMSYALASKAEAVYYGAHAGDHAIYPDCRPEFVRAMDQIGKLVDWTPVDVVAPFLHLSKADIAMIGTELAVPFEDTWSCYRGGVNPCGTCGACHERARSFDAIGRSDPLLHTTERK